MEQETLEEAAKNYGWRIKRNPFSDVVKANELADSAANDFIEGARWMEEQMEESNTWAMLERLARRLYEFKHGHPFLLEEEVEIILDTRLGDTSNRWMNDRQVQKLVNVRVEEMYKRKFPDARRWSLKNLNL